MLYTMAHHGEPYTPSEVGHTVVVGIAKKKSFSIRPVGL